MTHVCISWCQLLVVLKELLCIFIFVTVVFVPSLLHYCTGASGHDLILISDSWYVRCYFLVFIMSCARGTAVDHIV